MRIGVLHPGEMGVSVAQALADSGHEVCWVSAGRSPASQRRGAAFVGCAGLAEMLDYVEAVVSVCPPHAAAAQAQAVAAGGFGGTYVDANAVAPRTAAQIAQTIGAGYVDGGIIGPPALQPGTTRLYLSGPQADAVAQWFSAGALAAVPVNGDLTAASALKMAYAAYTKGSSALVLAVNALAESAGVRDALIGEWEISQPGLAERSERTAAGTSRKAWRFVGEMHEIADTFAQAGLPADFHRGAAQLYERMAGLKDLPPAELEVVLRYILEDA